MGESSASLALRPRFGAPVLILACLIGQGRGRNILLGLDSVLEGVDLPRRYCPSVFIDEISFRSPVELRLASHSDHLISKGMHLFPLLKLPKTGSKFAQTGGRLIRTESALDDMWNLDRLLHEKSYGRKLIRSTPLAAATQL